MQEVEHQMIYSPERKNNSHTKKIPRPYVLNHSVTMATSLTLLAADPHSSRLEWILLCLLS
jgi:hypothetical protein